MEFDSETLATVGIVDHQDELHGQITSAHPHQDRATGDLVNYLTHHSRRSEYRVYRQAAGGTERKLSGVAVLRPLVDAPLRRHGPVSGARGVPLGRQPAEAAAQRPACFAFHHINAWEEGEDIVLPNQPC
ncbi:carotenoid oxygenase family protein [Streptomyces sp. NPDC016469]|uniref:carotenoid oxygenase family protein n=1 Tax=Streptomyces sp. NPDC016469 TaxID=3157191 RepID=UPI0033E3036E